MSALHPFGNPWQRFQAAVSLFRNPGCFINGVITSHEIWKRMQTSYAQLSGTAATPTFVDETPEQLDLGFTADVPPNLAAAAEQARSEAVNG